MFEKFPESLAGDSLILPMPVVYGGEIDVEVAGVSEGRTGVPDVGEVVQHGGGLACVYHVAV